LYRETSRLPASSSGPAVEDEGEVRKQAGGVPVARFHGDGLEPALAAAAVDQQGGTPIAFAGIDDPVFADRRHLEVERDVAVEVLVGGVGGGHFHHDKGGHVAPV